MKERLDNILVNLGYFTDVKMARSNIMLGNVIVDEKKIDKAGTIINLNDKTNIKIKGIENRYVSRGGIKLEKAINSFNIDVKDKMVLDIGASTGGFTDCMLQNGAKYVYSVDVGTNQLDYRIRSDSRVKSIENMHIKDLTLEDIDSSKIDIIVMDVSFISVKVIFKYLKKFINDDTILIILIKPQFEAKKELIEKGGIVKDINHHIDIIAEVSEVAEQQGVYLTDLEPSPIRGGKGNIEYLSSFQKNKIDKEIKIREIVLKNQILEENNEK